MNPVPRWRIAAAMLANLFPSYGLQRSAAHWKQSAYPSGSRTFPFLLVLLRSHSSLWRTPQASYLFRFPERRRSAYCWILAAVMFSPSIPWAQTM